MISPRERYPNFSFEKSNIEIQGNDVVVHSYYRADPDISFHSTNIFRNISHAIDLSKLDVFAFSIGLVEMMSYWKATCSPKIVIEAGTVSQEQIDWWKDLLICGMGEYFYKNQIDFTQPNFVTIESCGERTFVPYTNTYTESYLVPVGGGKDSTVTTELFKRQRLPIVGLAVNPTKAALNVLSASGVTNAIIVDRRLDPKILELNTQGFYNGHVPFSASIAFISLLAAALSRCRYIAVSNEQSANEKTVEYLGREINHQYSKTYEFEKKFREYTKKYVSPEIEYFSFLRPLSELQISKLFSGMSQYFGAIRSCNRGQKTNSWCCNCPKCLSTYILLYPFIGKDILEIFPQNLYDKESLFPILQSLIDSSMVRPFECVGTREENITGLYLATKTFGDNPLPVLLQRAHDQYLSHESNLEDRSNTLLSSWDDHHFLPEKLEQILKNTIT
jgi:UDP-N-acetyl-alpha-D-muramoyl-L-alanyl-L-glutamate epimerase